MPADLPPADVLATAHVAPLPYELRLAERPRSAIDLVIVHCTETPDLASARRFGEAVLYPGSGTGNSGHYYIDRDGTLHVYVRPERIAHHTRGYNERSVGIELVNSGRYPHWLDSRHQDMDEPYTEAQIRTLIDLLAALRRELPALSGIAGHEDLDTRTEPASDDPTRRVFRKRDPGPRFPWPRVLAASGLQRLPAGIDRADGD
ncbi:N-acetylmuramoyl-L-alanine amidase [Coralloluteibacterium thermophilus]|uniref:N-acetylmuramoyl-L-alanine amidase n=1 Tax=Coralloluteibacterium thermophilum TaxID=2707049 RepID=A0ABV9NJZ8_9GAMM